MCAIMYIMRSVVLNPKTVNKIQTMKTPKILSISDARKNIFKLADEAGKPGNHIVLTENGRPKVVMMSAEEFESWKETLAVTALFPNLKEDIVAARQAYRMGSYITLDDILAREGYVLADKGKQIYGVSNRAVSTRAKRSRKNQRKT
jgi:prevent-host-death family protein